MLLCAHSHQRSTAMEGRHEERFEIRPNDGMGWDGEESHPEIQTPYRML